MSYGFWGKYLVYHSAPTYVVWRKDGPRRVRLTRSDGLWLSTITAHGIAHGKSKLVRVMGSEPPIEVKGSWAKAKQVAEVTLRLNGIELTYMR